MFGKERSALFISIVMWPIHDQRAIVDETDQQENCGRLRKTENNLCFRIDQKEKISELVVRKKYYFNGYIGKGNILV